MTNDNQAKLKCRKRIFPKQLTTVVVTSTLPVTCVNTGWFISDWIDLWFQKNIGITEIFQMLAVSPKVINEMKWTEIDSKLNENFVLNWLAVIGKTFARGRLNHAKKEKERERSNLRRIIYPIYGNNHIFLTFKKYRFTEYCLNWVDTSHQTTHNTISVFLYWSTLHMSSDLEFVIYWLDTRCREFDDSFHILNNSQNMPTNHWSPFYFAC